MHQNLPYHSRCTINYRALTDTYCKGCVFSEPAFSAQLTPPELCLMRNAHARSGLFAFVWFRVSACSFKIHPGISRCSPLEAVRGGGLECARRGGGLLSRLGLSSVDEISRRRGTFGGSTTLQVNDAAAPTGTRRRCPSVHQWITRRCAWSSGWLMSPDQSGRPSRVQGGRASHVHSRKVA
jgi:hypothetical protein